MKLNNRGVTLIELIVSVVLVTVIMGLMYKLILDVNNMQNNDTFASKNQLKRNEIIKTIENDLINEDIINIEATKEENDRTIIKFYYIDSDHCYILSIKKNILTWTKTGGSNARKWTIDEDNGYSFNHQRISVNTKVQGDVYSLLMDIEVYTDNSANSNCDDCRNNPIDDIIISYTGTVDDTYRDAITNLKCFGYSCE